MPTLTELRPNGQAAFGFSTGSYADVADESDATYIAGSTNSAPGTTRFSLTDTPADFLSVDGTLTINVRCALSTTGDDTWTIRAVLCDSSGSTTNYGSSSTAQNVTSNLVTNKAFTVTGITANKAQMDAAHVEIIVTRSQSMGGDGNHIRVHRIGASADYLSDTVLTVDDTVNAHTSESPALQTPPVYGFINGTFGESHHARVVPLSNRRYAIHWNTASGLSGDKRFSLLRSTTTEDGWEDQSPATTGDMGSIGINSENHTWKQSATQVGYMHNRYGSGGNPDNSYAAALFYNSGTDSIGSPPAGSLVLTAGTGGSASSPHADRLSDTHAIFIHNTISSTDGLIQVRSRVGRLDSSSDTSYTFGSIGEFGFPRGTSGVSRVVGISSTRAVVFTKANDGAGTSRISAKIVGISDTTLSAVSGSWTDVTTDYATDAETTFSATLISGTRILLIYAAQPTQASTDRSLKAVIVDVASDTITVGTPITIASRTTTPTITSFKPTSHTAILSDEEIFVATQRRGGDGAYSSRSVATGSGVTSLVISKAPSVVDTDVMWTFIAIDGDDGSVTITPPAGWTHFRSSINSGNVGLHAYYKTASSEGADYTWGFSSAVTVIGSCVRTTSSIFDDMQDLSFANDSTGSGTSVDAGFLYWGSGYLAISAVGSQVTHTPPTGYTEQLDQAIAGACSMSIASDLTGPIGGQGAAFTISESSQWAAMHIPIPSNEGAPVAYTLSAGESGTDLEVIAGPVPLHPSNYEFNGWDYQRSFPTTESTPHKVITGAYLHNPEEYGGFYSGVGFWDVPQASSSQDLTKNETLGLTDSIVATITTSQTITDDLGITDDVTYLKSAERSVTDALGLTDSISSELTISVTITDTIGMVDEPVRVSTISTSEPDPLGITDSILVEATYARDATDPLGLVDSESVERVSARTISDALGITDETTGSSAYARELDESEGLSDPTSADTSYVRSVDEALGITDSIVQDFQTGSQNYTRSADDSIGLTDSALVELIVPVTITDDLGMADSVAQLSSQQISITDGLGISDDLVQEGAYDRSLVEAVGITDASDRVADHGRSITDLISLEDSSSTGATLQVTITDSLGISDDHARDQARDLEDSLGIQDIASSASQTSRSAADTIGILDTTFQSHSGGGELSEILGITDSVFVEAQYTRDDTSIVGLSDFLTAEVVSQRDLVDSLGLSDDISYDLSVTDIVTDSLGITDSVSVEQSGTNTVQDDLGITDSVEISLQAARTLADNLGITDSTTAARTISVEITDQLGVSDDHQAGKQISVDLSDTMGMVDEISVSMIYSATIMETLGLTDQADRVLEYFRTATDPLGLTDSRTSEGSDPSTQIDPANTAAGMLRRLVQADSLERTVASSKLTTRNYVDSLSLERTVASSKITTRNYVDSHRRAT